MTDERDPGIVTARIASLRGLFETWSSERILYRDADLIAVDKPEGISTHAPDEHRKDDVHTRLLAYLAEHPTSEPPYLGIHQRLDRDTSGVLVFARRKAANAKLAAEFEGRRVRKTYLALVEGKLRLPADGVLRHTIEEGRDGVRIAHPIEPSGKTRARPTAVPKRGRGSKEQRARAEVSARPDVVRGKEALTSVRIVEQRGPKTLLELSPLTGRTHQIRVQLAAIGAPVVGDTMYGGAPARRLMLHAHRIALAHPATGEEVVVESPAPPLFEELLAGEEKARYDTATLTSKMREAANKRYGVVSGSDTHALRLVNGAGDGLAGIALDAYGDNLVVHSTEERTAEENEALYDAALALGAASVYVKHRPKHASRIVDARREEFAPKLPVRGAAAPTRLLVEEQGVSFEVALGDGLSTGLFLDQRENRARVREWARGKSVLNLFAYTGSFSVTAVLGGASATTTVDVSPAITAWAARNLARAGADPVAHRVIEADCFAYLDQARARGERFDLVILDPPSFATTKQSRFSADGDYRGLAAKALALVSPGGRLLACTNHQGIVMAKFRRFIHEAARDAGVEVAQMKSLPPPEDFPPPPGLEHHLKSVVVRTA